MSALLLGEGEVFHGRPGKSANQFRYPIFYLNFSLREEAGLRAELKKRFHGWLGIRASDFLAGESGSFAEVARSFLRTHCDYEAEEMRLQTLPRMFGYAFNPVSFWWCYRAGGLEAVLCEVNNTFGERHFYWIRPAGGVLPGKWVEAAKVFHVSPFFPVEGYYRFRFALEDSAYRVNINYHGPEGELRLGTTLEGRFRRLTEYGPGLFLRYGWMTPLIVFRIHFQALRLFFKRARFHGKPTPPIRKVTS